MELRFCYSRNDPPRPPRGRSPPPPGLPRGGPGGAAAIRQDDAGARGLLHSLLGVVSEAALLDQPWVGASWEGFVIEQVLAHLAQRDRGGEAFFFRTSDQHEVDLVLDFGDQLWAIEIKLTATPGTDDMLRLNKAADLIGARRRILVSRTARSVANDREASCSLPWFLRHAQGAFDIETGSGEAPPRVATGLDHCGPANALRPAITGGEDRLSGPAASSR